MSRRVPIEEYRRVILRSLDDEWRSTTDFYNGLKRTGRRVVADDHYRIALVLERLVNDGLAELERPGGRARRFRRKRAGGGDSVGIFEGES